MRMTPHEKSQKTHAWLRNKAQIALRHGTKDVAVYRTMYNYHDEIINLQQKSGTILPLEGRQRIYRYIAKQNGLLSESRPKRKGVRRG